MDALEQHKIIGLYLNKKILSSIKKNRLKFGMVRIKSLNKYIKYQLINQIQMIEFIFIFIFAHK